METIATTYPAARSRFLEAAATAGARLTRFDHPLAGLDGEELSVDVATLGPDDSESLLVVVSGTHGVEGYAGSALQTHWLSNHAAERPDGIRLVMIHGLNPYGFSWVRRTNEDNVDLNRNFIDWDDTKANGGAPNNDEYAELGLLLVPTDWTKATQGATFTELLGLVEAKGLPHFQDVISRGQYHDPTGLFYGGTGPVWSHRWLREWASTEAAGARRVGVIDLHTGLGDWGTAQFIGTAPEDSAEHARATDWWGNVVAMGSDGSVSSTLSGDWVGTVPSIFAGAETTAMAIEYGTIDTISVLQALRADAQLHAYGDPTTEAAAEIRAQVRGAFCDDDPAWAEAIWEPFATSMAAGLNQLS